MNTPYKYFCVVTGAVSFGLMAKNIYKYYHNRKLINTGSCEPMFGKSLCIESGKLEYDSEGYEVIFDKLNDGGTVTVTNPFDFNITVPSNAETIEFGPINFISTWESRFLRSSLCTSCIGFVKSNLKFNGLKLNIPGDVLIQNRNYLEITQSGQMYDTVSNSDDRDKTIVFTKLPNLENYHILFERFAGIDVKIKVVAIGSEEYIHHLIRSNPSFTDWLSSFGWVSSIFFILTC